MLAVNTHSSLLPRALAAKTAGAAPTDDASKDAEFIIEDHITLLAGRAVSLLSILSHHDYLRS